MAYFVHKTMLEKKIQKTRKQKKTEKILRNESETNIMDILSYFLSNQKPHFQNSFSKISILFSVLGSILSGNSCKLRHKLSNAPLRSKFPICLKIQFRIVL